MKIAFATWVFAIQLLFLAPVYGATYSFEVDATGLTAVKIELLTEDRFTLLVLPFPLEDIVVYGEYGPLLFDYFESETEAGINLHSQTQEVYVEGVTSALTWKQGADWVFKTNLALVKGDEVSLTLPPEGKIGSFAPGEGSKIGADKNRVVLTWAIAGDNAILEIESYYTQGVTDGGVQGLSILALLAGGMVLYALLKRRQERAGQLLLDLFDHKERQVIQLLQGRSSVRQRDLQLETGFSKSTLSVVLKRLENKKAVTRRQRGKTNLVELNREVFE